MNNSSWPTPQQQPNPWSAPDPSYAGPQFQDRPGRDPRQPFGTAPTAPAAPPTVQDFQQGPKRNKPAMWLLFGVIALVVVGILISQVLSDQPDDASPTPSGPAITYNPSAAATNSNVAYFDDPARGQFELVDYEWRGDQLFVRYRINVEDKPLNTTLLLYNNKTLKDVPPDEVVEDNPQPGQTVEGTASFTLEKGDATLILAITPIGKALTAIHIPG